MQSSFLWKKIVEVGDIMLPILLSVSIFASCNSEKSPGRTANNTLILVHVIFRHGDRTPDQHELDPTNPFYNESNYEPGYGQITKQGRVQMYEVGTFLRKRYGDFLGNKYYHKLIEGRSSDYNRTKESLQLVFAGLFPPSQDEIWMDGLLWQPVPSVYVSRERDTEMNCLSCKRWELFYEVLTTPEGKEIADLYYNVFQFINNRTNQNIDDYLTFYYYYYGFKCQENLGLSLPDWSKEVYPHTLFEIVMSLHDVIALNKDLRRITGGYLMKKIVSDTDRKIKNTLQPQERKMFLYSGHDFTILCLLGLLNLREGIGIPTYGSQLLIELHEVNETFGIKLLYKDWESEVRTLKLSGYNELIPFNDFRSYLWDFINMDETVCTGTGSSIISTSVLIFLSWLTIRIYGNAL